MKSGRLILAKCLEGTALPPSFSAWDPSLWLGMWPHQVTSNYYIIWFSSDSHLILIHVIQHLHAVHATNVRYVSGEIFLPSPDISWQNALNQNNFPTASNCSSLQAQDSNALYFLYIFVLVCLIFISSTPKIHDIHLLCMWYSCNVAPDWEVFHLDALNWRRLRSDGCADDGVFCESFGLCHGQVVVKVTKRIAWKNRFLFQHVNKLNKLPWSEHGLRELCLEKLNRLGHESNATSCYICTYTYTHTVTYSIYIWSRDL